MVSLLNRTTLWGRAANRCSFPDCGIELTDNSLSSGIVSIGEVAHIISGQKGGPRYVSDYNSDLINSYENLILLCRNHHKLIDSDVSKFSAEELRKMKSDHEKLVIEKFQVDDVKQKNIEYYAIVVEKWEILGNLSGWLSWTEWLILNRLPKISKPQWNKLNELHRYLDSRQWPKMYPDLESAFQQFNNVLEDFLNEFDIWVCEDPDENYLITTALYRKQVKTAREQDVHDILICELTEELTKCANQIIGEVQKNLFNGYRIEEGIVLLRGYPADGISYRKLEYLPGKSYLGLREIESLIKKRIT